MKFTNDYTVISNSDTYGLGTVDNLTNTVTLVNAATQDWHLQAVDYYIYLEQDGFVNAWLITARTADTITIDDLTNVLINGDQRWEIKGYKKEEVVNLVGLSISYAEISRSYDTYDAGTDGELV